MLLAINLHTFLVLVIEFQGSKRLSGLNTDYLKTKKKLTDMICSVTSR